MAEAAKHDPTGKSGPSPENTGKAGGTPEHAGAGGATEDDFAALSRRLSPDSPLTSAEDARAALVAAGLCPAGAPAVFLELFGGLRLRTGCEVLPLRAGTVGEALGVLRRVFPKAERLLPGDGEMSDHYRFSINGGSVTTDLGHPLAEGDRLILFSASVGG